MATKKGFFQKPDQKKQYSENVLNNVESAYRPKNRGRVRNPISSNTMSGEEADQFEEPLIQTQDTRPQVRFKKPVAYAFAGPQAKRQKQEAQPEVSTPLPVEEIVLEEKLPEPEIRVRTGKPSKKKTDVAIQKRAPKKSQKLSQPEIQVRTGSLAKKLSEPEIQVRTGSLAKKPSQPEIQVFTGNADAGPTLESTVACELLQAAIMLEAMQELEVDVHETRGNYEPIQEAEVQAAMSLGLQQLFSKTPWKSERQYELEWDSTAMDEYQQTESVEVEITVAASETALEMLDATDAALFEEPLSADTSAAELGLSFDPAAYRKDRRKTQVLNIPKQGIKRSHRGTIEAVFQPNGNVVEARYNCCGILIEVNVGAALKLTRAADTGKWTISYLDGSQPVNRVDSVVFDRLGNLCYSTEDGRTIVICADGRIIEK